MIYKDEQRRKQANTIKGRGNPHWKGGQITKLCIRCSSPFQVYPCKKDTQTHCSLTCANRDMADAQRGIPNPLKGRSGEGNALYRNGFMHRGESNTNWKGEQALTRRNALIRESADFEEWRNRVFIRDDYTCQHCGKRGGELNAHHKKSFALYPEVRFDIDNGLTLCVACHRETF